MAKIERFSKLLLTITLYMHCFLANSQDQKLSHKECLFGVTGGVTHNFYLSGDIYSGYSFIKNAKPRELILGYTYLKNATKFDGIENLKYNSHGIFVEENFFLNPTLFWGTRFSLNMNFVEDQSIFLYEQQSIKDAPTYFTGMTLFGHIGYDITCTKKIDLRLKAHVGIQKYIIGTGAIYFYSDLPRIPDDLQDKYVNESQMKLLVDLSIGIIIK